MDFFGNFVGNVCKIAIEVVGHRYGVSDEGVIDEQGINSISRLWRI